MTRVPTLPRTRPACVPTAPCARRARRRPSRDDPSRVPPPDRVSLRVISPRVISPRVISPRVTSTRVIRPRFISPRVITRVFARVDEALHCGLRVLLYTRSDVGGGETVCS